MSERDTMDPGARLAAIQAVEYDQVRTRERVLEARMAAALRLAPGIEVAEALLRGAAVPAERLDQSLVRALGLDGDVVLDEALAFAVLARGPETSEVLPFSGLSHAEVLDLSFGDEPPELIEGLIPRGVLVTVAGIPETYKGWLCQSMSVAIAEGAGSVLDRPVVAQGPVGYFWQDDSTRNEAERVQVYARVHETRRELPIRWFLNEGLLLPRDLARLRATIEHFGFILVVIDSFYNVAADLDLKEREAGAVFVALKAQVCDPTGCTVVVVDHMPWATETNRKRLRGYGDVFKNAAVRAGIYIDADGAKFHIEARGNNIVGFRRTPAYWDAETLELRLVDSAREEEADEDLDARVLDWLTEHPGQHSTTRVREAIRGRGIRVDQALERLKARDEVRDVARKGGTWSGRRGDPRYWIASIHAAATSSQLVGTTSDRVAGPVSERATSSRSSHPRRGDEVARDEVRDVVECIICEGVYLPGERDSEPTTCPACMALRRGVVTEREAGSLRALQAFYVERGVRPTRGAAA